MINRNELEEIFLEYDSVSSYKLSSNNVQLKHKIIHNLFDNLIDYLVLEEINKINKLLYDGYIIEMAGSDTIEIFELKSNYSTFLLYLINIEDAYYARTTVKLYSIEKDSKIIFAEGAATDYCKKHYVTSKEYLEDYAYMTVDKNTKIIFSFDIDRCY